MNVFQSIQWLGHWINVLLVRLSVLLNDIFIRIEDLKLSYLNSNNIRFKYMIPNLIKEQNILKNNYEN